MSKHSKQISTLGLDVSTSITGLSLFVDDECKINEMIDTRNKNKFPTLYDKANLIKDRLVEISKEYKVDQVYIERSLFVFTSGRSSAQILSKLSRFNGIISWISYDIFKVEPILVSSATARKSCGIKVARGQNSKQVCLDYVLDEYQGFVLEYTKSGNPKPGTFDKSDSYIVAKAGWEDWNKKNLKS